jgi:hypothetical protein
MHAQSIDAQHIGRRKTKLDGFHAPPRKVHI